MHISPRALRRLADDVDDLHRAGLDQFREEAAELHLGAAHSAGRRAFLRRVATGGLAITVGHSLVPLDSLVPAAGAQQRSGAELAAFGESVELAIIAAYEAGADLFDPAVLPVAQRFAQHHQDHADVFAELAGDAAAGGRNQPLMDALAPIIERLSGQADMVRFVRDLENQLVATYGHLLTTVDDRVTATGIAMILPIESAHAVTLGLVLGESTDDLFPSGAFESTDIAQGFDPAVFPVRP